MTLVYASLARQVFEKSKDLKSKGLMEEVREFLSLKLEALAPFRPRES